MNNNSRKMSLSFGKGKNGMATIGLLALIVVSVAAYYFAYKSNRENFAVDLSPASDECIVALFYAPWCGHCKTFKPEFEKAKEELDGKISNKAELKGKKVRFVKIDCDEEENKAIAKKYDISGYPTVKIIKSDGSDIEYDGGRSLEGLRKYLVVN